MLAYLKFNIKHSLLAWILFEVCMQIILMTIMYNVVFMSSLINLKNAAIKICSWHVHLFAGQFLHDYGGVSMFQWQWMFLSFPFYVFNLHWRMCFSNGENTCYEHQNINEFPVHTKANCVINLSSNLIVPR